MKATSNGLNTCRSRRIGFLPGPRWLSLLGMLAWVGLALGAEPPSAVDPSGTYMLHSVDGKAVPCKVEHDGHTLTIQSGRFVIAAEGTCTSRMVFSVEGSEEATRDVKATYTMAGSKLTMQWEGAGTTIGTVDSNTFTMANEGMVLLYMK